MGEIVNYHCRDCGHSFSYTIGSGMLDYEKYCEDAINNALAGKYGEYEKKEVEEGRFMVIPRLCSCKKCRTQEIFPLYIRHFCSQCGEEMDTVPEEPWFDKSNEKVYCPKCKSNNVIGYIGTLFD